MVSMRALPAQRCVHIGIVVRDAWRSAAHYAKTMGACHWSVVECDASRVARFYYVDTTRTLGFVSELTRGAEHQ